MDHCNCNANAGAGDWGGDGDGGGVEVWEEVDEDWDEVDEDWDEVDEDWDEVDVAVGHFVFVLPSVAKLHVGHTTPRMLVSWLTGLMVMPLIVACLLVWNTAATVLWLFMAMSPFVFEFGGPIPVSRGAG